MQQTLRRVLALGQKNLICVANEAHRFLVQNALDAEGVEAEILLEPFSRNTAPALAAAATILTKRDPDAILLSLPADHHIGDTAAFRSAIDEGFAAAQAGWIVTFGVSPDSPSPEYGYIAPGSALPDGIAGRRVDRFVEKPDVSRAAELVASGHVWNAGIFLLRADVLLSALDRHAPDVLRAAESAVAGRRRDGSFVKLDPAACSACRPISIDHAVLEHHDKVAVVEFRCAWTDLGSWDAVASYLNASLGNFSNGEARFADCKNVFVQGSDRLTVAVGLSDVLIVDTPDALLVSSRGAAESLRSVVADLEAEDRTEVSRHRKVQRSWGSYERICSGANFEVRRLSVRPGGRIAEHDHLDRTEHWMVVRGTGRMTFGDGDFMLEEKEHVFVPARKQHALENPGPEVLEIIAVLSGTCLGDELAGKSDLTERRVGVRH